MFTRLTLACLVLMGVSIARAQDLTSAFTYQGQLREGSTPANGPYEFIFELYSTGSGGAAIASIGSDDTPIMITVADGLFTTTLDFASPQALDGNNRWLEVHIRPAGSANYETLSPRQQLTPAPYARKARSAYALDAPSGPQDAVRVDPSGNLIVPVSNCCQAHGSAGCADAACQSLVCGADPFCCNTQWDGLCAGAAAGTHCVALCTNGPGRVGIGITNPQERLHVSGNVRADGGQYQSWGQIALQPDVDASGDDIVRFLNSSGGENMRIDADGRLGIGTTTPSRHLHVVSSSFASALFQSANEQGTWLGLNNTSTGGVHWNIISAGAGNGEGAGSLLFKSGGAGPVRMMIDETGKVGIGTTTPSHPLEVNGSNPGVLKVQAPSTTGTWLDINNTSTGGRQWSIISSGSGNGEGAGHLLFYNNLLGTQMVVQTGGNVGIGTITPAQKLHVNGLIQASCGIVMCSDSRFKEHIEPVTSALDKVEHLQGVMFDWKRDEFPDRQFAGGRQMGFIAQQVEKVLPEVVSKGTDGYLGVDYARLTPVLVEAVKQVRAEKDEQVSNLRRENAELKARLDKLESLMSAASR